MSEPTTTATEVAWGEVRARLHRVVVARVEDPATAEDIVQDVLLRIVATQWDPGDVESVPAWLSRVARNAVIDHYRTRRRHQHLDDPDRLAEPVDETGPNWATRSLASGLRSFVEQLPPIYRDAVTLVDLDGCTHAEAARELGLSVSGAKSRVQRGRRQLFELVSDCCAVHLDRDGAIVDYTSRRTVECAC